jgi:hypothetical protein
MVRRLFLAGAALLGAIALFKPETQLPKYTLQTSTADGDFQLTAVPESPVHEDLQAEAFYVHDKIVRIVSTPCELLEGGAVRVRGPLPGIEGELQVGLLIGRAYSMPGAKEAWEELQTEGTPRPAFRVLSTTIVLRPGRDRSSERDRSGPPSP